MCWNPGLTRERKFVSFWFEITYLYQSTTKVKEKENESKINRYVAKVGGELIPEVTSSALNAHSH